MPRRKPARTGNKQHSKAKKRPRGWHRRAKKSVYRIWHEIRRDYRPRQDDTPTGE